MSWMYTLERPKWRSEYCGKYYDTVECLAVSRAPPIALMTGSPFTPHRSPFLLPQLLIITIFKLNVCVYR